MKRRQRVLVGTAATLLGALFLGGLQSTAAYAAPQIQDIPVVDDGFGVLVAPRTLDSQDGAMLAALPDDGDIVDVPDALLADALRQRIGQQDITRGKVRALTWLDINGLAVTDLTGLEYATRLSDFEMKNTGVTSLEPLRQATKLTYFFAGGSPITTIDPLADLPALNYVSLNQTQIDDIDALDGAANLVRLEIASTRISDLAPLQHSPLFREIYAQDTQVADLSPLAGLTALRTISVPNALVSDISTIAGLPEVTILNVNGNRISDVSMLDSWPKLQQVGFASQQLAAPTVYPSATETSYRKTDTAAQFQLPDGEQAEVETGADALPGGGTVWQGLTPATTEISAKFSHRIRGTGPLYSATVTYPVSFADFDRAPAAGSTVKSTVGKDLNFDFSTRPEFTGGAYSMVGAGAPGVTLSQAGVLAGKPSAAGEYDFTVVLTDGYGNSITRPLTLEVEATPVVPEEEEKPAPVPTVKNPDAQGLAATGGTDSTLLLAAAALLAVMGALAAGVGARRRG